MKKIITWFLIADGARARLFKNEGPGKGIQAVFEDEFIGNFLPTRDLVSDRPGRTFDSNGPGRHSMSAPSDAHRMAKKDFARQVVGILENGNVFDRLVIVAPAKALGDIRSVLSKGSQEKITGEITKDLTNISINDLPKHLSQLNIVI
ncbi:MAG: host attachment protein [Alphaproteobacteria bacterium]|jgi:protein required for attachment to host cells|nr:host attachment protein [Alphaproteobacteria bacterium]MBT5389947.1 host attachment protein [Alphaproteobacteria bacterium]MBT5540037.1 host attachment protein [Alphaproteobacteria bacterium]MBT5654791.1 host attachment protein [Alphaproteobacteria bacterium]